MKPATRLSAWRPTVQVFIPYFQTNGRMESPDYDLASYREEVASWFQALGLSWSWVPVTLLNLASVVNDAEGHLRDGPLVVLNLCDGNELDGSPGVSVVRALEEAAIPFTGGSSEFYDISTYKTPMKARLQQHGVATASFLAIARMPEDVERIDAEVGYPAFIKPEVSSGSGGIGLTSRVQSADEALARISTLLNSEDGPFYRASGIFAEQFVDGPEFTALVVADQSHARGVRAYPVVERIFHSALPAHERFLSYDRYWSLYREEPRLPGFEPFYRYGVAPSHLQDELQDLAVRAFVAVKGTGYGRVDIRLESRTSRPLVLEVNANCGLSGDRETSVGELLYLAGTPAHHLVAEILIDAGDRAEARDRG